MPENARVTAFTVSKLLREDKQGRGAKITSRLGLTKCLHFLSPIILFHQTSRISKLLFSHSYVVPQEGFMKAYTISFHFI